MKITTTAIALLLSYAFSLGQSLPDDSQYDWKSSVDTASIVQTNVINISKLGADKTGETPCDVYVQTALNNSKQTGAILYFPKGSYLITEPIVLSSNQYLIGEGSDKTLICFDLEGSNHLISSAGTTFGGWSPILSNNELGETSIQVSNSFVSEGDLVQIRVNDNNRITSNWASGTIGQITKVKEITDSTITLADALRIRLDQNEKPQLIKVRPQKNIGVANLKIVRLDQTDAQTNNIQFNYTENAVVSGIQSDSCNFAHVNILRSYKAVVENSYFTKAFDYGNGGNAYGVVLAFTSSQCLVQNNIFQKLRHSLLFQAGPNGNIVGYNYSTEPYWTGVFSPSDFAGDIVLHGNYPFMNLIEGNTVQNIVIDNSHGINGPGNTFMRNRIENAGIFMNCNPASDGQVFIGNEITGKGMSSNGLIPFPRGLYSLCGNGHYEFANNKNGTLLTENVTSLINSYYLDENSSFINSEKLPIVGYPNVYNSSQIPAYSRFRSFKKTIDYKFPIPLGPSIKEMTARKKNEEIIIEWKSSHIEECESFKIFRINDADKSNKIATVYPEDQSQNDVFQIRDASFNKQASFISYFVEYHDDFGDYITSDTIKIKPDGQIVSISSDGLGYIFSSEQLEQIEIFSITGKLVFESKTTNNRYQLPKTIPSGNYILQYRAGSRKGRKKLVLLE